MLAAGRMETIMIEAKKNELRKIFKGGYKAPENWKEDPNHFEDDIFEKWLDNFEDGLRLCEANHDALLEYLFFCRIEIEDVISCINPEWGEQLYWILKRSIVNTETEPSRTLWGINRLRAYMDAETPFEQGMYLQSLQYNF